MPPEHTTIPGTLVTNNSITQPNDDQNEDDAEDLPPISVNTTSIHDSPVPLLIYADDQRYYEAQRALAHESVLLFYRGEFYNLPALSDAPPPFYYVTRGSHIGVFSGW